MESGNMKSALLGIGVTLVVIAGVAGLLTSLGKLHFGSTRVPFQVPGDPPVMVSDGSLHAHSSNGWVEHGAKDQKITANPVTGSLVGGVNCKMHDKLGNYVSAFLWTDDDLLYPIQPGATIQIKHDSADAASANVAEVDITLPNPMGPLQITTQDGYFEPEKMAKGGKHNRQHSRPGEVESITITNPGVSPFTWPPAGYDSKYPHFTLAFCYQ
jgi:hypothetical protein